MDMGIFQSSCYGDDCICRRCCRQKLADAVYGDIAAVEALHRSTMPPNEVAKCIENADNYIAHGSLLPIALTPLICVASSEGGAVRKFLKSIMNKSKEAGYLTPMVAALTVALREEKIVSLPFYIIDPLLQNATEIEIDYLLRFAGAAMITQQSNMTPADIAAIIGLPVWNTSCKEGTVNEAYDDSKFENCDIAHENNDLMIENGDPMLENDEPTLENVEPTLKNVEPTLENDESKLENYEPKLENDEPKLENDEYMVEDDKSIIKDDNRVSKGYHLAENQHIPPLNLESCRASLTGYGVTNVPINNHVVKEAIEPMPSTVGCATLLALALKTIAEGKFSIAAEALYYATGCYTSRVLSFCEEFFPADLGHVCHKQPVTPVTLVKLISGTDRDRDRILGRLGSGGEASIMLARDSHGRYAIKSYHVSDLSTKFEDGVHYVTVVSSILRELTLSSLIYPAACQCELWRVIPKSGTIHREVRLRLPALKRSLDDWAHEARITLQPQKFLFSALTLLRKVYFCVEACAQAKVVHADLKTSNVLLNVSNNCRDAAEEATNARVVLTDFANGGLIGAPLTGGYSRGMEPPELHYANPKGEIAIDIWGFGALTFQLFTGGYPPLECPDGSENDFLCYSIACGVIEKESGLGITKGALLYYLECIKTLSDDQNIITALTDILIACLRIDARLRSRTMMSAALEAAAARSP